MSDKRKRSYLRWGQPRKSRQFHLFAVKAEWDFGANGQKSLCGKWKYHGVFEPFAVRITSEIPDHDCQRCCAIAREVDPVVQAPK